MSQGRLDKILSVIEHLPDPELAQKEYIEVKKKTTKYEDQGILRRFGNTRDVLAEDVVGIRNNFDRLGAGLACELTDVAPDEEPRVKAKAKSRSKAAAKSAAS